jgi:asparagine synthase (glutamine-hydrolysing)
MNDVPGPEAHHRMPAFAELARPTVRGICGWVGGPPSGAGALASMLAHLPATGPAAAHVGGRCGLAASDRWQIGRAGSVAVAICGRPDWTRLVAGSPASHAPVDALASAYREAGMRCLERLGGSFALAAIDESSGAALVAIDRIGQHPLFYTTLDQTLVFSTTADGLRGHPDVRLEVGPQGIYDYLYCHMLPSPTSIYADVRKLPAAHCLVGRDGAWQTVNYWRPQFREQLDVPVEAAHREMMTVIRNAVRDHADSGVVGAFLSGGLDSSTVAGMLAEVRPGAAHTFSIGFNVPAYDESGYARIAAEHFKTVAHTYYVTEQDVLDAIPAIAAAYDEPFGNSSVLPAYFCARLARQHGIEHLLGGDGGDELFAGNERYAKQGVFEHYQRLPAWLRRHALEPVLNRLPPALPPIRKAQSYVRQANVPLPDRLQTYNYLNRFAAEQIFEADLLAAIDPDEPRNLERETYRRIGDASVLNRMLYLDWQITLADNDLRKVTRACELASVEVSYPLLDDAVVELSTRIPSDQKLRHGRLRHFYKEATRDFLPAAIIEKEKHGFGLPFGVWLVEHEGMRELARDSLDALKRRRLIRADFIDRALALHAKEHASYYGELVWVLMVLELWLAAH